MVGELTNLFSEEKKWTIVDAKGNAPSARYGHTATLHGDCMYLFGGCDAKKEALKDLHVFNFSIN